MKLALYILAVYLFVSMPTFVLAAADGNALLQKCEPIEKLYDDPASLSSKEASGVVYCLSYIDSFIETFDFQFQAKIVPGVPYCLPEENLPKKEIVKVVVGYLKNHSEELDKPAGYYIFMALREEYPCTREESSPGEDKAEENKTESKAAGDK